MTIAAHPTPATAAEISSPHPRLDWFRSTSFGLFIHFDQASQLGVDLSWPMVGLTSDDGSGVHAQQGVDYLRDADRFDPREWDPRAIASAAKAAGMQYAVFTTKHHSGWAAWPSEATPLNISTSPYGARGGDLVREYVDAFRDAGLRIGFYYSVSDWSDPDYPAWRAEFAPYAFEEYPRTTPTKWSAYREGMKAELTELLTNYGRIDLLWFDGGWERTEEEWDSADLEAHIRSHQPAIVLNDRLPGVGDYVTPEQSLPAEILGDAWEACITMNNTWGWDPDDHDYKTPAHLIRTLVDCVANGGSLLLNVGPSSTGALPPEEETTLHEIAGWMRTHRDSVIGARPGLEPWQFYGPTTTNGDDLYLHLIAWPDETTTVRGIRPRSVLGVELLTTGEELPFRAIVDPAHARNDDPVGNLLITIPPTRPAGPLPVVRVRFRPNGSPPPRF
ncbi:MULTISPECIES: alpha-L-fucosidase [unclassified Microbacterium]|uniref:alpha-L-fucosidase n=1 Tax=unclassified Microbacterium TaxID=2609290 RepID=UPI000CFD2429|nr:MULTISPECIES: alpha-L-fucosidase [unclassified Microbacterium]PQZ51206.1 alpha-L-fucosidase [Microbacterium sp. MYb43]PQZ73694.1 alpha-L-fucosidase [Microbacterium sp. MYb40]PRB15895.1 alpha-L-fucosidase [Microbacterium sp. MYb54]PRB22459.1 alpha-L-fucosidase [Microbacterium sp. MYb50]PRB60724.1 alpha-L-fucosidase [Microbacterium sp. MYb24]